MFTTVDRPLLLDGRWLERKDVMEVRDPEDDALVARVAAASSDDARRAARAAERAGPLPRGERAAVLERAARLVEARASELADTIAREGVKTIRESRREVARCAITLRLSSIEAMTVAGEEVPFDATPGAGLRFGGWTRVPVGPIAAITPFNDPLNLVAHKVGPAVAAGCPIVVKPHERTPLSALALAEALTDAGLPPGWLQVLPAAGSDVAGALVRDGGVRMVSFTGGAVVGRKIIAEAGVKRVSMELGSNCATIICADADLDTAVPALASGAFAACGQNCLHVQRVLIQRDLYDEVAGRLVATAADLTLTHKLDEHCDMGVLIDERSATRVQGWVDEAMRHGAEVLHGGDHEHTRMAPTLIERVPETLKLYRNEVFGPVTILAPFEELSDAVGQANRCGPALQHAVFTSSLDVALDVAHGLRAGGVVVNETSDTRVDQAPFGGTGIGREGVRFAIADMTEPKLLTIARTARAESPTTIDTPT